MPHKLITTLLASLALIGTLAQASEIARVHDAEKQLASCSDMRNAENVAPVLDRTGLDRAAIHLQILQQSQSHFSGNCGSRKTVSDGKPTSSSKG